MIKQTVAVIFGGQSSEHEVSCMSAANVIRQMDLSVYNLLLIGITKDGRWLRAGSVEDISSGRWYHSQTEAVLLPDASKKSAMITLSLIHI